MNSASRCPDIPDGMRLFYALWPDEATRAALSGLASAVEGRRTRAANLHVTLAFLGEQPASALPDLQDILEELPGTGFDLLFDRLGYFSRQHITWAGMEKTPDDLHALHEALAQSLQTHKIAYDRRSDFKPHVTLARNAPPPERLFMETAIIWQVRQVALVRSVTQPRGVDYRIVACRSLKPE